jgi:hypothetical protein
MGRYMSKSSPSRKHDHGKPSEAALVELPIAVVCLLLARSVERRLAAAELAAEDCA